MSKDPTERFGSYPPLSSVNSPEGGEESLNRDGKLRVHQEAGARLSGLWGKGKEKRGHRLLFSRLT
jgi:hypothetical protein